MTGSRQCLLPTAAFCALLAATLAACGGSAPSSGESADAAAAPRSGAPRRPEQVFRYEVSADASTIRFDFDIAEGGYLYRSEFAFESGSPDILLGAPRLPQGEMHSDEFFGEQEIYRDRFRVSIPYSRTAAVATADILLGLRGCDDTIGICYPPQDWTATVALPAGPLAAADSAAGGLVGSLFAGSAPAEALPIDQAFYANVRFDSANELTVSWQIAPGYYLYRDGFSFDVDGEIQLGAARLPAGKAVTDLNFGETEVYYDFVEIVVPFSRAHPDEQLLAISAGFQGCKDDSICYPPSVQLIELTLPASDALPASARSGDASAAAATGSVSEQGRFADLIANGSWVAILGAFYVAGLALSLTPCVLPMVPILSGIIAGQGQQVSARRGFALSLSYVLGMALTYTVAGALTALAGAQVQAIFQEPWIIASFAGLFVLMAFGMFGLFEIQMPTAIQSRVAQLANRQRSGSFVGTALIGALTALVVTTCVAPPLIGALAVIGQTGDVPRGAAALFALSIGMGTPLLLVGASAGKLLPKVGPWMNAVKAGFGVMMVGMAIWMLDRILPGTVILLLWALLVFLTGVFLGAFDPLPAEPRPARRLAKGLGVLACLYGAIMLIGWALGGDSPLRPIPRLAGLPDAAAAERGPEFVALETVAQLETLLGQAKAAGQPVFIEFTADWCASCKEMEAYTFPDAGVIAALEPFMRLQADISENNADDKALLKYFDSVGPPTMPFYDREGKQLKWDEWWLYSYVPADEFIQHVRAVAAL